MSILIACEESQAVTKAFRAKGYETYSCDLQDCSGGHPEWHIKGDCVPVIKSRFWDLIVFHPECTYMAVSGNRWYGRGMPKHHKRLEAIEWTVSTWSLIKKHSDKAAMENPISVIFSQPEMNNHQYVQPWWFGHKAFKATGFELYGLSNLIPTDKLIPPKKGTEEYKKWSFIHRMPPCPERSKLRSKTFPGIADAMAGQWGCL